jgi:hypothetical protein
MQQKARKKNRQATLGRFYHATKTSNMAKPDSGGAKEQWQVAGMCGLSKVECNNQPLSSSFG